MRLRRLGSGVLLACGLCLPSCGLERYDRSNECEDETTSCTDSATCPRGTYCQDQRCTVDLTPTTAPNALTVGLQVAELELVSDPNGGQRRFSLVPSAGVHGVVCGLFTCEPSFTDGPDGSRHFKNLARCLARERIFHLETDAPDPEPLTFTLHDLERLDSADSCTHAQLHSFGEQSDYPVVTSLSVGCWTYQTDEVKRATRLLPVLASELPGYGAAPLITCTLETKGNYCYVAEDVGVCAMDKCDLKQIPTAGAETATSPSIVDCTGQPYGTPCASKAPSRIGVCDLNGCVDRGVAGFERALVVSECVKGDPMLAAPDTSWLNCFPSVAGGFGTCRENVCAVRCRSDQDCEASAPFRGLEADELDELCLFPDPNAPVLGICKKR